MKVWNTHMSVYNNLVTLDQQIIQLDIVHWVMKGNGPIHKHIYMHHIMCFVHWILNSALSHPEDTLGEVILPYRQVYITCHPTTFKGLPT